MSTSTCSLEIVSRPHRYQSATLGHDEDSPGLGEPVGEDTEMTARNGEELSSEDTVKIAAGRPSWWLF